jgi:hypothetical protein
MKNSRGRLKALFQSWKYVTIKYLTENEDKETMRPLFAIQIGSMA